MNKVKPSTQYDVLGFSVLHGCKFLFVLKHIAYTFRNIIYGQDKDENNDYSITRAISNVRNHKPIIELVTRPWNN